MSVGTVQVGVSNAFPRSLISRQIFISTNRSLLFHSNVYQSLYLSCNMHRLIFIEVSKNKQTNNLNNKITNDN